MGSKSAILLTYTEDDFNTLYNFVQVLTSSEDQAPEGQEIDPEAVCLLEDIVDQMREML